MNDGGPAFPRLDREWDEYLGKDGGYKYSMSEGMSLRDYFAAKAMQGWALIPNVPGAKRHEATIAKMAYELADAMIAERSK